jgi:hypothetical protein
MSWERPDFTQYVHFADVVRVSVSAHKGRCLRIAVGRNIWRKMGWSLGRRCEIEYGAGNDAGWLRVVMAERGRTKMAFCNSKARDGSMILKTNRFIPGLRTGIPHTVCKHVVTPGGDLLIKLSQEFWDHERKKPYAPKAALRTASTPASMSASMPTTPATNASQKSQKPKQNGAFSHSTVDG